MTPATLVVSDSSWQKKVQRRTTSLVTFGLSGVAAVGPMVVTFYEPFNFARLGALLVLLILLHLAMYPRLVLTRETALYVTFFVYMSVSVTWAPSTSDALNTLIPAADFILTMILFGSLIAFHSLRSVLMGALVAFLLGALIYTRASGFPFAYPPDFSYNAIAGMYLFGLLITLLAGWYTRSRFLPLIVCPLILVHLAATTSIKTNLGVALGAGVAAIVYVGRFLLILRKNIILLGVVAVILGNVILSSDALVDRVQVGFDRVSHGVQILQRREDVAGNTSFTERQDWVVQGIKGWLRSPVFGNGVEAFRADYGITSHSTPVDLLYNFGIVGFVLFYLIFASIVARLWSAANKDLGSLPAIIVAGTACYLFITLSGTMHYNNFFAIFVSMSTGLLRRQQATAV
jgi:O-antigen ligase